MASGVGNVHWSGVSSDRVGGMPRKHLGKLFCVNVFFVILAGSGLDQ